MKYPYPHHIKKIREILGTDTFSHMLDHSTLTSMHMTISKRTCIVGWGKSVYKARTEVDILNSCNEIANYIKTIIRWGKLQSTELKLRW